MLLSPIPMMPLGRLVLCLLALSWQAQAGVPGVERPHTAEALKGPARKTDSGCACRPWSATKYNESDAVKGLGAVCADPEGTDSPWCFTMPPCATPTDTCTKKPAERGFKPNGDFTKSGCQCESWTTSKWNQTLSSSRCADPDYSGYKWCFVKTPCIAAQHFADGEPWDYCDAKADPKANIKVEADADMTKLNENFMLECGKKVDDALGDAKECELRLHAIARKGNSQTGVTEIDRQKCWESHEAITMECKAKLAVHNNALSTVDSAAAAKMNAADAAAAAEEKMGGEGGMDFGAGLDVNNAGVNNAGVNDPASVIFDSRMGNWTDAMRAVFLVQMKRDAKAIQTMVDRQAKEVEVFKFSCETKDSADSALTAYTNASKIVKAAVAEIPNYRLTAKECDIELVRDTADELQMSVNRGIEAAAQKAQEEIISAQDGAEARVGVAEKTAQTESAELKKLGLPAGSPAMDKTATSMQVAVTAAKCSFANAKADAINTMKVASLSVFLKSNMSLFIERVNHKNESIEVRIVRIQSGLCDMERPCCGRGNKTVGYSIASQKNVTKCFCQKQYSGSYCQDKVEEVEEMPESEAIRRERAHNATIMMANRTRAQRQAENALYSKARLDQAQGQLADQQRFRVQRDAEELERQRGRMNASEFNKNMTRNNSFTHTIKLKAQLNKTRIQLAEAQQQTIRDLSVTNAIESGSGKAVCVGPFGLKLAPGMPQSECCGHGSKPGNSSNVSSTGNVTCNCSRGFGGEDCSYLCEASVECCGNGAFLNGTNKECNCTEGFSGADCAVGVYCSGHGFKVEGACICRPGWKGESCQNQTAIVDRKPDEVEDVDAQKLLISANEGLSAAAGNKQTISASDEDIENGFAAKATGHGTAGDLVSSNKTNDAAQRAIGTKANKEADQVRAIQLRANATKQEVLQTKAEFMVKKIIYDDPTLKTNSSSTEEQVFAANAGVVKTLARKAEKSTNVSMFGNEKVVNAASNLAQGLQLDGTPTLAQEAEMDANVTGKGLKTVAAVQPVVREMVQNKTKILEQKNATANATAANAIESVTAVNNSL